jgi:transforming growth factor-beta-induced protein
MKRSMGLIALTAAAAFFATGAVAGPEKTTTTKTTNAAATKNIVETAVGAGSFTTLADLLVKTGLDKALAEKGPFTVFAPTDEAFKALGTETLTTLAKPENRDVLVNILKQHVVMGNVLAKDVKAGPVPTLSGQRFNITTEGGKVKIISGKTSATVAKTDVLASNGVIHVIDNVIVPNEKDIVGTAVVEKLSTFNKLVAAADLGKALMAKGNFTVFAPSDEAFAKLDKALVESLLQPENKEKLQGILKYHVIGEGRIFSDAAGPKAKDAKVLNGGTITIIQTGGKVLINNATVTKADIDASNGVIHVIDTVLIPGAAGEAKPAGKPATVGS